MTEHTNADPTSADPTSADPTSADRTSAAPAGAEDRLNPAEASGSELTSLDWPTPRVCGSPSFTCRVWTQAKPIKAAILDHPFVTELTLGTLDRDIFLGYLAQDALYLDAYARAMAAAAAQATSADDIVFWAGSARDAIVVERELHASRVADFDATVASPTTTGYTSYLLSLAASGCYPALAAGVLPCFWVYEYVGTRIMDQVLRRASGDGDRTEALSSHPYGDWIGTYDDPHFREATTAAIGIVDRLADEADVATRARMQEAFMTACRYEWMFWDAAYRQEGWPV